jgi:hypothetical protein
MGNNLDNPYIDPEWTSVAKVHYIEDLNDYGEVFSWEDEAGLTRYIVHWHSDSHDNDVFPVTQEDGVVVWCDTGAIGCEAPETTIVLPSGKECYIAAVPREFYPKED